MMIQRRANCKNSMNISWTVIPDCWTFLVCDKKAQKVQFGLTFLAPCELFVPREWNPVFSKRSLFRNFRKYLLNKFLLRGIFSWPGSHWGKSWGRPPVWGEVQNLANTPYKNCWLQKIYYLLCYTVKSGWSPTCGARSSGHHRFWPSHSSSHPHWPRQVAIVFIFNIDNHINNNHKSEDQNQHTCLFLLIMKWKQLVTLTGTVGTFQVPWRMIDRVDFWLTRYYVYVPSSIFCCCVF